MRVTRAKPKALVRVVSTADGELVAELSDRALTLRPLRTRRGGPAAIRVSWGLIYLREMLARAEDAQRARRRDRWRASALVRNREGR